MMAAFQLAASATWNAVPGIVHAGSLSLTAPLELNRAIVNAISNTCIFPTMASKMLFFSGIIKL